jgi:hypothetical protein
MIKNGYTMKGAYDYGKQLQAECGTEFMERERADFQVYDTYTKKVSSSFRNAYNLFIGSIFLLVSGYSIVILLSIFTKVPTSFFQTKALNDITDWAAPLLIFAALLTWMIYWGIYNYQKGGNSTVNPYKTLYKSISSGNTMEFDNKDLQRILKNQRIFLGTLLVTMTLALVLYNPIVKDVNLPFVSNMQKYHSIFLLLIAFVFIPMISEIIAEFQNKIQRKYEIDSRNLNDHLKNAMSASPASAQISQIQYEIESNIVKAYPERLLDGRGAPDLSDADHINDSGYRNTLYQYAMHIINNADIQGIFIPSDLKPYIQPIYLRGENIIALKRVLSKLYQDQMGNDLYVPTSFQKKDGKDGPGMVLLPYLISNVQYALQTGSASGIYKDLQDKVKDIINDQVIKNPMFAKADPLPTDIQRKLSDMRKNSYIKDVIDPYYKKVNLIMIFLIFGYIYGIYHRFFVANPELTTQQVSFFAFFLLIILGFLGWFSKQFWL